jgi:hypothetical protein
MFFVLAAYGDKHMQVYGSCQMAPNTFIVKYGTSTEFFTVSRISASLYCQRFPVKYDRTENGPKKYQNMAIIAIFAPHKTLYLKSYGTKR